MINKLSNLKRLLVLPDISTKNIQLCLLISIVLLFLQIIFVSLFKVNPLYLTISLSLSLILLVGIYFGLKHHLKKSASNIGSELEMLAGGTQNLVQAGQQMQSFANESSEHTKSIITMSANFNDKINSIASATTEVNLSINEIAKHTNQSLSTANNAVEIAQETREYMNLLLENNKEIETIVNLINSIAEQTNLLALNATIESARAGEAGKGFAVVASEVKELAQETANATKNIRNKVSTIHNNTEKSVDLIESIHQVIGTLNDYQSMIASAIEEQAATTKEISRNIEEINVESQSISQNIMELETISTSNINCVEESLMASEMLGMMCLELKGSLEKK